MNCRRKNFGIFIAPGIAQWLTEKVNPMKRIELRLRQIIDLIEIVKTDTVLMDAVDRAVEAITSAFERDQKVLFAGNGGSAADAQHLAAELSGRFYFDRPPLFAEALHVNTSYLTAVANDYSYEEVYSRLVQAKARKGDVLVALSTSGNSTNIVRALQSARKCGVTNIGLTGHGGGIMAGECDILIAVPSTDTPRIQEMHITLGHLICEMVESSLFTNGHDRRSEA